MSDESSLPLMSVCVPGQTDNSLKIYNAARSFLDKHITLDENVPHELGCAEALSMVLKSVNTPKFPPMGFAGTYAFEVWLEANFKKIDKPVPGAIIISPTIGKKHGHIGVCGKYGIMSNDSNTGLFLELWTIDKWIQNYKNILGLEVLYYQSIN